MGIHMGVRKERSLGDLVPEGRGRGSSEVKGLRRRG